MNVQRDVRLRAHVRKVPQLSGHHAGAGVDSLPNLWEARDAFPGHADLWDALRSEYWAALLCLTDLPAPSTGG
jgi:hypothetical protein